MTASIDLFSDLKLRLQALEVLAGPNFQTIQGGLIPGFDLAYYRGKRLKVAFVEYPTPEVFSPSTSTTAHSVTINLDASTARSLAHSFPGSFVVKAWKNDKADCLMSTWVSEHWRMDPPC